MSSIVVVGSLNMDLVINVPHIPKPGETILGDRFLTFPGGKGANQAVAAARLGADVTMIGCVGNDTYGEQLISTLKAENINTEGISVLPDIATGVAMISVAEDGQNSIAVASGANFQLTPDIVRKAMSNNQSFDLLIMPLEVPLETVLASAELAKKVGAKVILNPAPAQALSESLKKSVDILVPNEIELAQITSIKAGNLEDLNQAAKKLLNQGISSVVITLGDKGSLVISKSDEGEESQLVPPFQVKAVDTTAAGDAFVAALSVGIGDGMSITDAARFANAAGALAATKPGAQPSLPLRSEVERFFERPQAV